VVRNKERVGREQFSVDLARGFVQNKSISGDRNCPTRSSSALQCPEILICDLSKCLILSVLVPPRTLDMSSTIIKAVLSLSSDIMPCDILALDRIFPSHDPRIQKSKVVYQHVF